MLNSCTMVLFHLAIRSTNWTRSTEWQQGTGLVLKITQYQSCDNDGNGG